MKVIDLINRCLCRDDTLPQKIIYKGKEFALKTNIPFPHYYDTDRGVNFMSVIEYFQDLEEEVEIVEVLEEDKEIEEINIEWFKQVDMFDAKSVELAIEAIAKQLNETIKAVNELKKGK